MTKPRLLRIDNLDVFCRDVQSMLRFYRDDLGLELLYPVEPGEEWFAVQCGDVTVYFFEAGDKGAHGRSTAEDSPGIDSFSFAVDDLDAAIADLDDVVRWRNEIETWRHPNGTWYRFRFFEDPEGNTLSITEPHKAGAT